MLPQTQSITIETITITEYIDALAAFAAAAAAFGADAPQALARLIDDGCDDALKDLVEQANYVALTEDRARGDYGPPPAQIEYVSERRPRGAWDAPWEPGEDDGDSEIREVATFGSGRSFVRLVTPLDGGPCRIEFGARVMDSSCPYYEGRAHGLDGDGDGDGRGGWYGILRSVSRRLDAALESLPADA